MNARNKAYAATLMSFNFPNNERQRNYWTDQATEWHTIADSLGEPVGDAR